mgnify:CR=1 FL=1
MNAAHRELIENIIKQNPAYKGNEHLMEQFCAEVYKKSYLLLDSVSNVESLKNYLKKVADTSVLNVIKSSAAKNIREKINSINTQDFDFDIQNANSHKQLEDIRNENSTNRHETLPQYSEPQENTEKKISIKNPYEGLIDPREFFPERPTGRLLAKNIIEALLRINTKEPAKKFLEIFIMKYVDNLNQTMIARNLKLTRADLSKRYCEMVKLIRQEIL